jgi:CDP-diacylglycerol--glycerol-3-phosphate 3-phosphatidyltransferase
MHFNLPNTLTWFRIGLIPLVIIAYKLPYEWAHPAAAWMFGVAAITDTLDGYLARKLGQTSAFGAFLDPVADKVIVCVALLLIVQTDTSALVLVIACIIVGREITISALREWMAEIGARHRVAVQTVAKYKTIGQMVGLAFMLHDKPFIGLPVYEIGLVLLVVAAGLTLWSMWEYIAAALPDLSR